MKKLIYTLLLILTAAHSALAEDVIEKPNVVIILLDDMGYGDIKPFNPDSKIPTPHIDTLARDGIRFTDAHAPGPLCHMSRYGLMTGTYPFRTNVTLWPKQPLIKPGQMTIASLAKSQGYRTAMVGKWHLGFKENGYDKPLPGGPVDCGFHSYFGIRASTDIPPYFYIRNNKAIQPPSLNIQANRSKDWSPIQGAFWRAGGIAPNLKLPDVLPRFTDEAITVIETHAANKNDKRPLMLYLAYPAPHTPWLPSEAFKGKSGAGMYGDFLMMVDAQIGRVLTSLKKAGMHDNTLLIFTSDNGPVWYEQDTKRFGHNSTGGLRGMKSDAWEAGHRMPFIVRWPNQVKAGGQSNQLICFTDLLATFADLFNTPLPPNAGPDSFSFLPILTNKKPSTPIRENFVMRAGSVATMMTIRSGDWKLITGLGSGGFTKPNRIKPGPNAPQGQLYNLANDPGESNNLYLKHPDIVAQLTAQLKQVVDTGQSRQTAKICDPSTLNGKVMVGYQGWFNCPGDGSNLGWKHWAKKQNRPFAPGNVTVDLWPDVSELDPDELYNTGFTHKDGTNAPVFSSANRKTVIRHFKWMKDYGIDGAFIQRFANGLNNQTLLNNYNVVLNNAREGAKQSNRTYAIMYDLSGLRAGQVDRVRQDWISMQSKMNLTNDPNYQNHNGKPLVAIWGIGFSDNRKYTLSECHELVKWFKSNGCSVMLGTPTYWRESKQDAISDPLLHQIIKLADVINPWNVGRYANPKQVVRHATNVWLKDQLWCKQNNLDFLPVVFPGFSWYNLHGGKLNQIPRLKGEFFWSQIQAAKHVGSKMIYIAMFDEVDEGTAIFKCTNNTPGTTQSPFIDYEGLPNDHYLKLAGRAGQLIRNEIKAE